MLTALSLSTLSVRRHALRLVDRQDCGGRQKNQSEGGMEYRRGVTHEVTTGIGICSHVRHRAERRHVHQQLAPVLEAYALLSHQSRGHDRELAAFVHRNRHVARAQAALREIVRDLIAEAAERGELRADVAADELAGYCLHALAGAGSLESKAAVRRLVMVTLAGMRDGRRASAGNRRMPSKYD